MSVQALQQLLTEERGRADKLSRHISALQYCNREDAAIIGGLDAANARAKDTIESLQDAHRGAITRYVNMRLGSWTTRNPAIKHSCNSCSKSGAVPTTAQLYT